MVRKNVLSFGHLAWKKLGNHVELVQTLSSFVEILDMDMHPTTRSSPSCGSSYPVSSQFVAALSVPRTGLGNISERLSCFCLFN
ncbi:hypothetical protein M413DRAFT_443989 [Hebeloma cylindrosporum]|uniref:Uncharacterized protein n=1 Tax=Hebeloma cylindrosporum TaxID=76867 RepID=A0A0C2YQA1_HEBCY|nr:hypothetical protein M413DRAFT_443989 [Hebeloma cylindrosporum h7]